MGLTGGCLCGRVRYELRSEPFDCGWCHCRTCQLFGGAPAMVFATVPSDDFAWTRGKSDIRSFRSSSFGRRTICGECGTPMMIHVDHQPETVDFPVATLDEPESIEPQFHIFWARKIAWFDPGDDLPRHEKLRPDTRGLDGTEPPDESSLVGGSRS